MLSLTVSRSFATALLVILPLQLTLDPTAFKSIINHMKMSEIDITESAFSLIYVTTHHLSRSQLSILQEMRTLTPL